MAEKAKETRDSKVTANLTPETVKNIAESVGISGLPDGASAVLASDTTYRLKQMVQVYITNYKPFLVFKYIGLDLINSVKNPFESI